MQVIAVIGRLVVGVIVSAAITLGLFLILPLMQQISEKKEKLYETREISMQRDQKEDVVDEPEPEEPEEEEEPEELEFEEEPQMMDLTMLEMSLNSNLSGSVFSSDLSLDMEEMLTSGGMENMLDLDSFDTPPRATMSTNPNISSAMRSVMREQEVEVIVKCLIGTNGRVTDTHIVSGHQAFNQAVIRCVEQWRFDPAQRRGEAVEGQVDIPFKFPRIGG